jgi:hypothetical protein
MCSSTSGIAGASFDGGGLSAAVSVAVGSVSVLEVVVGVLVLGGSAGASLPQLSMVDGRAEVGVGGCWWVLDIMMLVF